MKIARSLLRLARLGFFVGLGAATAIVEACGGGTSSIRDSSLDTAPGDGGAAADAGPPDAAAVDAGPADASPQDSPGWDVPLE